MANAKMCDICGAYYDAYNTANIRSKPSGFRYLNIDSRGGYFEHDTVECCPECMKSITEFVNSLKGVDNNGGC